MGLNKLVQKLITSGVSPNTAAVVAQKSLQAAGAGGVRGGRLMQIGGGVTNSVLGSAIAERLIPGATNALLGGQINPNTVPMGGKGYIYTSADDFQYTQYYNSPGARFARATGVKMLTPQERRQQQVASVTQQMESANRREIEKNLATKQAEAVIRGAEIEGALKQQALIQEGAVAAQNVRSLGDVQKQRVQSGYNTASNLLQSAIENIAYVEKLGDSNVRSQLAALPQI